MFCFCSAGDDFSRFSQGFDDKIEDLLKVLEMFSRVLKGLEMFSRFLKGVEIFQDLLKCLEIAQDFSNFWRLLKISQRFGDAGGKKKG